MEHFRCAGNSIVVPIDRVLITKPIAATIQNGIGAESFGDVKELRRYHPKMSPYTGFSAPLNRIDNMMRVMCQRSVDLPPILVKVILTASGEYYDVLDGRHRLAVSVVLGFNAIPIMVAP
jgi:hypothetical protein